MAYIIPYVVSLLLAVNAASGLRCYNCNSKESQSCRFTKDIEECASAGVLDGVLVPKCFKITATNQEGAKYIAKGCLEPPVIGCRALAKRVGWISDYSSSDPHSVSDITCVTCETDECNSVSRITGFTLLGVLLAALAFLF